MSNLDSLIQDLVIANRVLAKEEVVDAYGHVSIRHPDNPNHFLIARSVAPDLVGAEDIVELGLDGEPVAATTTQLYLERLHPRGDFRGAAGCHGRRPRPCRGHAAVRHRRRDKAAAGDPCGKLYRAEVPVWDIADSFGDTNLLVTNIAQGRDLAKCLGPNNVALMRGHGFASAARSLIEVVRLSVYLPRNARALMRAKQLGGEIKYLSPGEIDARNRGYSPIRRRPGAPGNIGRTRPAAATC